MARVTRAANHLSAEEITERIQQATHSWHRLAWQVIFTAFQDPRPAAVIARQLGVSKGFVHKVMACYHREGPEGILPPRPYEPRHRYLSRAEERQFLEPFLDRAQRGDIVTAREIQRAFEERVGRVVAASTISRLLQRHQWRKIVPRPRHPTSDPEEQAAWKAQFADQVADAVATRAADDARPVLVMAQDEGRFGRISTPQRCWSPKGMRPTVPRQIVREYVYVYSAVAPSLGRMTALILPQTNTAMMNLFLSHVAEAFSDYFIVMQVDQAAWHRSRDLQVPENIRLVPQPARSPELNPVEHIWDHLREHALRNTVFDTLQQVTHALVEGVRDLAANAAALTSMTFFPHLRIL
ncbi:MAG: IS630 family transposase [Chloroflexaceae bacterium]|nr:IS630 family transposase [Chloroflexaceae bacterium]